MLCGIILTLGLPLYLSESFDFFNLLMFALLLMFLSLIFLPFFLYYRKQPTKWIIDKTAKKIRLIKDNSISKSLKSIDFENIKHLDLCLKRKLDDYYTLHFCLNNPLVECVKVYSGKKHNLIKLGTNLSHFMEKSLYIDKYKAIKY